MEQLLPLLPQPEQTSFTKEEQEALQKYLSAPIVQRYLKVLHYNALADLAQNECESVEQERKLVARFNKIKGIQYVLGFLINNFQGK